MIERTKRGHSPISMATAVGVHSAETGGLAKVLFFFSYFTRAYIANIIRVQNALFQRSFVTG